ALDFLAEARRQKKPFFHYLAFNAPHFPLHAKPADIQTYADPYTKGWDKVREDRLARQIKIGLFPTGTPLSPLSTYKTRADFARTGVNPAWDTLPADRRADLARRMAVFAAMVTCMDRAIGRVVDDLKTHGELDNTLVLFLSDNGRPFPRCKTTVYDSGCRTPLLARWPAGGVRAGSTTASLVSSIDIAPTLLRLAGAVVPAAVQGRGFAGVLRDPMSAHREYVFLEKNWHDFDDHARGVRSARFGYVRNTYPDVPMTPPADAVRSPTFQTMLKLLDGRRLPPEQRTCFITPRPAEELYDLDADPHELRNVVGEPRYADTLRAHRAALDGWIRETDDCTPAMRTPDGFDRRTGLPVKK
ncbi:MAG TPA: sulfatase-like hydrolase/transferase, partial [Urbifossiella sp.]|nr:sulfatase-like hydrolase/transferase [Urbifossiella sp.]